MAKPTKEQEKEIFQLFSDFHNKKIDEVTFLFRLERKLNTFKTTKKSVWFRFFGNDTAATTIDNIKRDLNTIPNCYQNNRKYMLENIEIAVTENSLNINYS